MDIHRSRFVPFTPSAINALAFSHAKPDNDEEDPECLRLAIGRANGNIEIWNPAKGAWLQERIFSGGAERSVEGLQWTQEPDETNEQGKIVPGRLRLFSIGYSSSVTEWDLVSGLPIRHSTGNHSEVWCFAAQPRPKASTLKDDNSDANAHQRLVAGCADGTLVLLSTADNDLRFEKFLSRSSTKKARVLSVTWKDRNTVLAGYADSTIRVFDTRNGTVLRNISLGSGPPGGPKDILVWKVKCLSNGDFVSGDSTGDIRIFDGKNYSQIQRISGHEADVLDLAVSQDGTMIFSGGMDRRTCFYTCTKKKSNRGEKWRKVSHQRYHEHDVKAMATYEGHHLNMMVSGGIDTQPVVLPLRQFGKELSRALPSLPQTPPLVSAPDARLMVGWWNTELRIWRVKSKAEGAEKPRVVARMALQGRENITSVSIARDGSLLAVATVSEVKLFQLTPANPTTGEELRIRKLELPTATGAKLVRVDADGKWLATVAVDNSVQVMRIIESEDEEERPRILPAVLQLPRLERDNTPRDSLNGPWGLYNRSVTHAEFSTDGNMFAVADLAGYIDTWVVQGHEDSTAPEIDVEVPTPSSSEEDDESDEELEPTVNVTILGQRWVRNPSAHLLPRLDSQPLLLSFQPGSEDDAPEPNGNPAVHPTRNNPHPHSQDLAGSEQSLLVVSAEHKLYHFEVLAGRLSEWSRRNPPSSYPSQFTLIDDPVKGCTWDVTEKSTRLWLYGEKWLFMFDLSKDFPISSAEDQSANGSKKRKRDLSRKNNSGAGDAVPDSEAPVTKTRKLFSGKSDESSRSQWIDFASARQAAESDDDDDIKHEALASLRRSAGGDDAADVSSDDKEEVAGEVTKTKAHESWWHSFKYRPILGIVPVGDDSQPLEVVLVERPSWDLDLPPRFVGSHE